MSEWSSALVSPRDEPVAPRVNLGAKSGRQYSMSYVYILLLKNNNLYTGFTNDLRERYKQHQRGGVESTKYLRPLKLVHYEVYLLEEDARRREKFLKTSDGKLFLRRQLSALFKKVGKYGNYNKSIL